MSKAAVSLRYKFLAIMVFLLTASILSYLALAIKLFKDDKIAYVYDGNSSFVEALSAETKTNFLSAAKTMRLISLVFNANTSLTQDGKKLINSLFDADDNFVELSIYDLSQIGGTGQNAKLLLNMRNTEYLRPNNLDETYLDKIRKERPVPFDLVKKKSVYVQNSSLIEGVPLMTVALAVSSKGAKQPNQAIVATLREDRLIEVLSRSTLYNTYVVSSTGQILAHPDVNKVLRNDSIINSPFIKDILQSAFPRGVKEFRGPDKSEVIVAFAKVGFGDITIISEIQKKKAFIAANRLIEKSLLFAILIIIISYFVSVLFTNQLTSGLTRLYMAATTITRGNFDIQVAVKTRDEVGTLTMAFNTMARTITRLMEETAIKAQMQKELETAKMVQSTFFPRDTVKRGPLTISGYYQPATECGGDWWGHFTLDEGKEFFCIADAMGHGVPAALVTAMAYSSCMTIADLLKTSRGIGLSPASVIERFNRILFEAVNGSITMTFFGAIIDTKKGVLTFSNAGHTFPILLPARPDDDRAGPVPQNIAHLTSISPISLRLQGSLLGLEKTVQCSEKTIELRGGDKLFFYTDGLIECTSPDKQAWGRKILLENIAQFAEKDGVELKNGVLANAHKHFANHPLADDITVVTIELERQWQAQSPPAELRVSA